MQSDLWVATVKLLRIAFYTWKWVVELLLLLLHPWIVVHGLALDVKDKAEVAKKLFIT